MNTASPTYEDDDDDDDTCAVILTVYLSLSSSVLCVQILWDKLYTYTYIIRIKFSPSKTLLMVTYE